MITWGISANSHDAALAVFQDGKLKFASHSERFSGIKNDRDLDMGMVHHARMQYGEPDEVIWYERPFVKTLRQFYAGQGWKGRDNDIEVYLAKYDIHAPISYVGHHHSHAAGGYFTSPFDEACVVVIDAIGEFETLTIWRAEGTKLTKVYSKWFPNSIGLFYSAMTQRIGLKPLEDEYILMGMSAYGDDRYYKRLKSDFVDTSKWHAFKHNLHRGCQWWAPDLIIKDSFDIARATQHVYEDMFKNVMRHSIRLVNTENLVLMGGCALNCLANRLTGNYYPNTWIMPNPGDAGSAVGAVLAKHPEWRIPNEEFTPYLGYDMGYTASNDDIVNHLLSDKICGLARGPAEFGPRALGNRSLIADPRGAEIKDKVNAIKQRQEFRPFAPAILEELLHDYFDMPSGWNRSRYMQTVATCRRPDLFPAIVHNDGTSRVQSVPADGSPFRRLLEAWYDKTGCPMLLNTSLNIKGQPMVNNVTDAKMFERTYGIRVFT